MYAHVSPPFIKKKKCFGYFNVRRSVKFDYSCQVRICLKVGGQKPNCEISRTNDIYMLYIIMDISKMSSM